jgi:hypothetical protein
MARRLTNVRTQPAESHDWLGTETLNTRLGEFDFTNSYPAGDAAQRLRDALVFNRAVETYLTQMPTVSWLHVWRGVADAGEGKPNQVVIWESLMDSATLLLTGNTETVYGLASLDLKRDGPIVVEVPPSMLGGINDLWQNSTADIGLTGVDKGKGGKFLVLPPDYRDSTPSGYLAVNSRTNCASVGVRGFQVEGKTESAVHLMKSIKIYPLAQAGNPPPTTFFNGSHQQVDTLFSDDARFFDDLAWIVQHEPHGVLQSHERFQLAAIGIEKGKPFQPDAKRRQLLGEAARLGSAIARTNSFASEDPLRLVYPDRVWEWAFIGGSATWDSQGYVNTDRRAAFAYIAIGMSPAMVEKHIGAGSQYLWTPRDADNEFLDGGKNYRLHIPPNIPVKNFWSVVAYDADSRSILRNDQPFPSVSTYTGPESNADGSLDIYFGPAAPAGKEKNWIQTTPGKGWFTLFRFYGPLEPFFDKTWKPDDVVRL